MGRVILVSLSQNDEHSVSSIQLEKFVREQLEATEISKYCSVEKITVLEDHPKCVPKTIRELIL